MAKNSLAANVAATINAIKDIKNALIERGTEINADTHILNYGNLIRNMKSGASLNVEFTDKDDPTGWDETKLYINVERIENNTRDFSFKVVDKIEGGSEELSILSEVLPQELYSACCATYRDKIYIFGGTTVGGKYLNTIYKFNCKNKTIETLSVTLPTVLSIFCCTIYEDNIYIFGGFNGGWLDTIYKFNCTTETIEKLSVSVPKKIKNSCCSIHNDNIYIFGGYDGSNSDNTIYQFAISFELTNNNVLIYNANSNYSFDLITDQVTIPIKNIYIGDSSNMALLANAYLYDDSQAAWVNVNTGEVLS